MNVRTVQWRPDKPGGVVVSFLRRPAFDAKASDVARRVLADIREKGNRAISTYARKFDGVSLKSAQFRVNSEEFGEARRRVGGDSRTILRTANSRIATFAARGMKKDWQMPSGRGGTLGEQFAPLERVGVYIPGGAAPLVSSVLMTVTLGKVAGVQEIVACTPCGRDRRVNPMLLNALEIAGATEVYKVGGIQAIGLMAYGTRTVRKVQKIVGPGGTYVTAAKKLVYGDVALDLVAGPSEIAVFADESADPRYVAADLLSQAEHGTGWEKALLVTTSRKLTAEVSGELKVQAGKLTRRDAVCKVLSKGTLLVVVRTLDEGMELCNRFAPEHLEIMVREPRKWLRKVRSVGAVFVGSWSPECAGDYFAGPSHVLPTGGSAAMFSGLTVDDFRRRTSFVALTRADLRDALPVIEMFGEIEQMDAHAHSARIRFEKT